MNASQAELNYSVGVTSAIQTQIDGKQASDQALTDISGLAATDGNFIVGDGANFVAESGATARSSLGIDGVSGNIVEGDLKQTPGSEAVTQATIRDSAVGQAQLKTAQSEVSTTSSTGANLTLPGGEYGFYPEMRNSGANPTDVYIAENAINSSYVCNVWIRVAAATGYARQRHIQASPPYDYGDGEVGFNTFAVVDNASGRIESVYGSISAPWHYNGPTDIRAGYIRDDGMPCRLVSRAKFECCVNNINLAAMLKDPATRDRALALLADKDRVELEIRQEIKNKDLPLVPHPFLGNDLTGKTVVMLDPISDLAWQLAAINETGESINEILHDGYMQVDNTALARTTPNGVIVVSATWKNT
jgi:hypothetical protein